MKTLFTRLVSWYDRLYGVLCGRHPAPYLWHFQWHGTHALNGQLRKVLETTRGRVLDFGCGAEPYRAWMSFSDYVGVDVSAEREGVIELTPGAPLPFPDDDFDVVFSTQVLEHVRELDTTLREIRRVLKPGGRLILSVPFLFPLHGEPEDYRRFSEYGVQVMLTDYSITRIERIGGVGQTLATVFLNWVDSMAVDHPIIWLLRLVLLPIWLLASLFVNLAGWLLDAIDTTGRNYGAILVEATKETP